jgi:hypothetical protein
MHDRASGVSEHRAVQVGEKAGVGAEGRSQDCQGVHVHINVCPGWILAPLRGDSELNTEVVDVERRRGGVLEPIRA